MITKSGIDTKNFEFDSAGQVSEELYMSHTSNIATGLYVLENNNGMEVCITNVGARIVSIMVPDKNGKFRDVVLGFDSLLGYIDYEQRHSNAHGAVIGRYANRIANGKFSLDGKEYTLPQNNGTNCLHGGPYGWSFQTYKVIKHSKDKLVLALHSPDGDMGFPGNVNFLVTYNICDDNSLHITYEAESDAPTVINVTNHAYFNLSGDHSRTILEDKLFINSTKMTPLNEYTCPNGEICDIEKNGPFDFFKPGFFKAKYYKEGKVIGQDINSDDEQIKLGNGYDHNFVIHNSKESRRWHIKPYNNIDLSAKVYNELSGITLEVFSTEPGIQLYDSVDLDGSLIGKNNIPISSNCGLCLETQHFADSPNHNNFPSTTLMPGEEFRSKTIFKFS